MVLTNLDMDVLRTLAVAMERGSFAQAAQRLGRSQSAVSLQMRKLEGQVGQTLFRKAGRGLALTEAGDVVLGYARRILELNDEGSVTGPQLWGRGLLTDRMRALLRERAYGNAFAWLGAPAH